MQSQWKTLLVAGILFWATSTFAQYHVNGGISGTITDASGAAVAGAKVTAINTENGTPQSTTTTAIGSYLFSDMPAATYTITVEKEGFENCSGQGLVLDPGATRTFSCALKVGATTETIQVQAAALQVSEDTSQLNSVINSHQIEQLPDDGRNFANFLALEPGVAGINFSDFNSMNIFSTQGVSVNGLRDSDNNILIEGVSSQRTRDNAAETAAPAIDAIGEVNIISTGYMPEYSRGAGAQIVVQLKSGTNQYHGSLYEYNQNTDYDSAQNHLPGLTNTGPNRVPTGVINWNNFGGTFGGPIPHTNHRLFFFFSEDITRQPGASTNNVVVPSALARQGNFSEYCQAGIACPTVPAWLAGRTDPNTGQTLIQGQPFPNNTIAQAFWSTNGAALLGVYPLPNLNNSVASGNPNFFYLSRNPNNNHTESLKVDYIIDPWKSHLAVSLRHYRTDSFSGNFGNSPQMLNWNIQEPERGATIDLATTFSPTVLNDVTIGSTEDIVHVVVPPGPRGNGQNRLSLGINYPYIFGGQSKDIAGKTPTIAWSGANSNIDPFNNLTDAYPSHSVGHIYQFSDVLTKVHGKHTFKFGAWIEHDGENDDDQLVIGGQNLNGTFTLGSTNDPHSTGLPLANLLLGVFDNYAEYGFRNETPWSAWQQGYFGQDSWKISKRLTIEGGLRWDYLPNYSSKWCNFAMFSPLAYSTFPGTQQVVDPTTGLLVGGNYYNGLAMPCNGVPSKAQGHIGIFGQPFTATNASSINQQLVATGIVRGYPPTVVPNRYRAFQPRFGFAWDPFGTGKTSIRGSAGIFYNHETVSDQIQMGRNLPFQTGASINNGDIDCPGIPQGPSTFGCAGGGTTFTPGPVVATPTNPQGPIPVTGLDYRAPLPVVYSYHAGLQHMFLQDTLVEIGYVGTMSRHFNVQENLNELLPGTIGDCTLGGGSVSGINPALCAPGSPYRFNNGATAGNATPVSSIVPYLGFSNSSFTYQVNNSNSAYNSLQASVQRRMSHNLMFTGVYTYANAHDIGSQLQSSIVDHYNPKYNVGNPDWLVHHNFTATYLYTLPFYQNQHNFQGRVLGGWELTGVVIIHSGALTNPNGTFGTVTDQGKDLGGLGYDPSGGTSYGQHADIVRGCNPNSGPRTYLAFFNTSCFVLPAPGTLGNAPRNVVFGPRFWIWDAGLHKNGNVAGERVRYQFRAEAVNVLNHPIPNGINTNLTSGSFGQINSLYGNNGDQRILQMGLRLLF
ncbi:MAG: TonB-dependent receptor [Acidobacteria bacterium]|nr:TonB-dependent receptor [Acidobacteriota bacterium]